METRASIPRLSGLPLLGNLLDFRNHRLALARRIYQEVGEIGEARLGPVPVLVLTSGELAHALLVEHADAFIKSRGLHVYAKPLLGEGLLTSEHEVHRTQRRRMSPAFSHKHVARYAQAMVAATERAQAAWADGAEIDAAAEMMRITLAIVGETLFGADVVGEAQEIGAALTVANRHIIEEVTRVVHVPLAWPTPRNRRVRAALARLDETIYRLVRERRASGIDTGDVLSTLIAAVDEVDGSKMSDVQIRDEAMTLFLAGHETTANALAWTFHLLGRNPEVYRRMRAEVDAVCGGRTVQFEDLPSLSYTLQVLKEAMRLYPPAYMVGRAAERDVTLGQHAVKKGQLVFVNIYGMHHRADYFPNPEAFDPERFRPEAERALPRMAYVPFGAGPRVCIGNHFALMEGQIALAILAQRVVLEPSYTGEIEAEPLMTLRPKGGIAMRVRRRAGVQ